jgi:hypothetical protein
VKKASNSICQSAHAAGCDVDLSAISITAIRALIKRAKIDGVPAACAGLKTWRRLFSPHYIDGSIDNQAQAISEIHDCTFSFGHGRKRFWANLLNVYSEIKLKSCLNLFLLQ